jgi:plastocyanin domain-containing protein
MSKAIYIVLIGAAAAGIIFLATRSPQASSESANNVRIENGVQVVEIRAKGGYSPRTSEARAGLPTVLRFVTEGSYDCSIAVRIPALAFQKILPQTGTTDVQAGTPAPGTLSGTCAMGMYRFEVKFI